MVLSVNLNLYIPLIIYISRDRTSNTSFTTLHLPPKNSGSWAISENSLQLFIVYHMYLSKKDAATFLAWPQTRTTYSSILMIDRFLDTRRGFESELFSSCVLHLFPGCRVNPGTGCHRPD